jgi:hypothetical protein
MKHKLSNPDGVPLRLSGDMILKAIKQVVFRIKENYKNSRLSIVTIKFVKRKIRGKDEIGYKMIMDILFNEKTYLIKMKPVVTSLSYNSIMLNITKEVNERECNLNWVPGEIKKLQDLILKEMSIGLSFPV